MTRNRLLSALVALIYIILAAFFGGAESAFKIGGFTIMPLACIWFSEAMGGYTGSLPLSGSINQPTPGIIVCILGWFLLFLPVIILVLEFLSE